jgi:hypothetical protein
MRIKFGLDVFQSHIVEFVFNGSVIVFEKLIFCLYGFIFSEEKNSEPTGKNNKNPTK